MPREFTDFVKEARKAPTRKVALKKEIVLLPEGYRVVIPSPENQLGLPRIEYGSTFEVEIPLDDPGSVVTSQVTTLSRSDGIARAFDYVDGRSLERGNTDEVLEKMRENKINCNDRNWILESYRGAVETGRFLFVTEKRLLIVGLAYNGNGCSGRDGPSGYFFPVAEKDGAIEETAKGIGALIEKSRKDIVITKAEDQEIIKFVSSQIS